MAISDPIADMLTRIRNAYKAKFNSVDVPGSTLKIELAKILKNEGYIRNYKFLKGHFAALSQIWSGTVQCNLRNQAYQQAEQAGLRKMQRDKAGFQRHGYRNFIHIPGCHDG